MGETTNIAWADATWNPWMGCEHVSPGCLHCLAPDTPVLMADLTWRPIGQIVHDDALYGFDDEPGPAGRLMRQALVTTTWRTRRPTVRITTESGRTVECSPNHRWLVASARGGAWRHASELTLGSELLAVVDHRMAARLDDPDYQAGYVAGVTAGDGTMRFDPAWRSDKRGYPQMYWRVAVLADDRAILDRLVAYLANAGVDAEVRPFDGRPGGRPMLKVERRAKDALSTIVGMLVERPGRQWCAGWLAGFLDTDGSTSGSMRANGVVHRWTQVYRRNDYLDRTLRYLDALGFVGKLDIHERRASTVRLVAGTAERFALVNAIAPALDRKGIARLYGDGTVASASRHVKITDRVVGLEALPEQEMVDISTTTGTFVAAGLSTHNCYAEDLVTGRMGKTDAWAGKHYRTKTNTPLRLQNLAERDGRRRRMFVASLADIFENPSDPVERFNLVGWRADALGLVDRTPLVDWLLLTKRPENVTSMVPTGWLASGGWPLNVWVGTTVEDAKEPRLQRVRELALIPAPVRFLSAEPLIEDNADAVFNDGRLSFVDWVIVGGESGPEARPMHPRWVERWRARCEQLGIAIFEKQWGAWQPRPESLRRPLRPAAGMIAFHESGRTAFTVDNPFDPFEAGHPGWVRMWKNRAREHDPLILEGFTHAEFPTPEYGR